MGETGGGDELFGLGVAAPSKASLGSSAVFIIFHFNLMELVSGQVDCAGQFIPSLIFPVIND